MDRFPSNISHLAQTVGDYLWQAGIGIVIALIVVYLSRYLRGRIRRAAEKRAVRDNFPSLINAIIRFGTYVVVILIILSTFGVRTGSVVTYFGLVTAALTLSLQDVLRNVFSGLYLLAEQPFKPGDRIRVGTESGRVERIDLRVTRLRSDRQEEILVPNLSVFTQVVGNTTTHHAHPMTLQFTAVTASPDVAETAIRAALAADPHTQVRMEVRILKANITGSDFEMTFAQIGSETQQNAIILALHRLYPEANLIVISR